MPSSTVQLLRGRTVEQKRAVAAAVTDAAVEALGARPGGAWRALRGQGTRYPAARNSSYHSGRVNGRSEPRVAPATRSGVVVPSTTCMRAG